MKDVSIGSNTLISWGGEIMDSDFHPIYDKDGICLNYSKPIIIGEHCWIGAHAIILKGSELAKGTIVAAGSVISGKYTEEKMIITSKKILKNNIEWNYALEGDETL